MRKALRLTCLAIALMMGAGACVPSTAAEKYEKAILVRINGSIDHWTADLVEDAVRDIENRMADTLLISIDAHAGYLYPSTRIARLLNSCLGKVIAYVGPDGASAKSYAAYVVMASDVLAMSQRTSIGKARAIADSNESLRYVTEAVRGLARTKGRNVLAAERMVTEDLEYSADEAHEKGICELKVTSYDGLLRALGIDELNVVEKKRKAEFGLDRQTGYELLKLMATPSTIKHLFFALTLLVASKILFSVLRPRRSTPANVVNQTLFDLVRMEMQDLTLSSNLGRIEPYASSVTRLHTPANMQRKKKLPDEPRSPSIS